VNNKKQIVINSLKALHRQRQKAAFRIKFLRMQRSLLLAEEKKERKVIQDAEKKILWEVNKHSDILKS
jgi:hypothetical protein